MAYIDFARPAVAGTSVEPGGTLAAMIVGTLDRREWDVVRLARNDGLASLRMPGRFARLTAWLIGRDLNRTLADPRLEALRRLAVLGWRHGYALPVSAIKEFKAAGFSMDQLEAVLSRITQVRSAPPLGAARA